MQEQKFGIKRSRKTTKPKVVCPEIQFYECDHCKSIIQIIGDPTDDFIYCCKRKINQLLPIDAGEIQAAATINYRIIGGYNENAIEVSWQIIEQKDSIEWVYIKTFTGGQIKYVTNLSKTSFIFALADEDAYVYCDEDPCLECTFRCKRGFEIFAYLKNSGLIKIPIERMQASW
ncbi:MAG: hypothetical protein CVU99_07995 [Firmicutes bacterium HGW-Firmicutes-4]|nr:MAG: hypothetical protein CVU99_07995 [Firmicutes bacterium HGW-Firmicutes-4]